MEHLFNQSVTLYHTQTRNSDGELSYGDSDTYDARVEVSDGLTYFNDKGIEIEAAAVAYMPKTATSMAIGDRLAYDSVDYKIVRYKPEYDNTGTLRFYKVILERFAADE